MKIHHIAIWTKQLERLKSFYVDYFEGKSNHKYTNHKKGFESYFIKFDNDTTLELMSRTDIIPVPVAENQTGLTHIAFTFESKEKVIQQTERLRANHFTIASETRLSGDGYFESVVLDPDGNRIECVYQPTNQSATLFVTTLETERLLLRPFNDNDAERLFACCQNPELGNNAGWKPHDSLEESEEVLQSFFMKQVDTWAIILKENNLLIGSIGLIEDPKRENKNVRMIGYWLDKEYWHKGYMAEASEKVIDYGFNELNLSLITAHCYPHNQRSKGVLKRSGFVYEGILHQAEITADEKVYDHECYYLNKMTSSKIK